MELVKGNTYYLVTYADPQLTMPGLEPVIFIGKNAYLRIEGENVDTYQFQDTVSFQRFGYVMSSKNKDECDVRLLRAENIHSNIVDLAGAIAILNDSLQRAKDLGWPTLKIAKGSWVTAHTETWVPNEHTENGEER